MALREMEDINNAVARIKSCDGEWSKLQEILLDFEKKVIAAEKRRIEMQYITKFHNLLQRVYQGQHKELSIDITKANTLHTVYKELSQAEKSHILRFLFSVLDDEEREELLKRFGT